ncbi:SGNH/GDSL hydrolase family protein [Thiohalobacter sp. IOR34]|uniref:SGNH/GDSL hydrolase family protein n=1 Tax=Thiohalobacter sp. IOR34 TaxID=3057176 RepID=UPI0025B0678A|nr:SGNH/GDSL hydrolase family protein [Thiohalobacter sp. IOR34]WJW74521.1 SGNH/GDSL hydrolase family protein [Thiohalobacter sp. IOR34]
MRGIWFAIVLLCFSIPATAVIVQPYSDIYVFGDSLSDTATRVTNGDMWVEYLAPRLGLSYDPAKNYALSGADSADILNQVSSYEAAYSVDPGALYVIWGGAMDIFNNPLDPYAVIGTATTNLANAVGLLASAGASSILVPNLPDLGLTPAAISLGIVDQARAVSQTFNASLASALAGYGTLDLDVYSLLNMVVADPASYGLSNVTGSCVDDSMDPACTGYLFYDEVHPTSRGHQLIGDAMYAAVVPLPASALLWWSGLAALALVGRRRTAA